MEPAEYFWLKTIQNKFQILTVYCTGYPGMEVRGITAQIAAKTASQCSL
jgi:hypothetical protein